MKIGIFTLHDGINYGAYQQVYTMQSFLQSKGHEVKVINYKNMKYTAKEFLGLFYKKSLKVAISSVKKRTIFINHSKNLNLTKRYFSVKKIGGFDLILFGSDEVWNYKSPFVGYDLSYFGEGINDRKISYAPSFGNVNDEVIPVDVANALKDYSHISIRDYNSRNIVENKLGLKCTYVCDPIFLLEDSLAEAKYTPTVDDHIVVYAVGLKSHDIVLIKNTAKKMNKKLVSIGYYNSWCDINYDSPKPIDWINMIKNSKYFVTNTFHGTMYSIKYNINLKIIKKDYWNNKISGLIQYLEMEDCYVAPNSDFIEFSDIDYERVNEKMDTLIKQSKDYLNSAINGENYESSI